MRQILISHSKFSIILISSFFSLSTLSHAQDRPRPQGGDRPQRREMRFRIDSLHPDVHDPVMAKGDDGKYYVFATGFGVQCMSSADMKVWAPEKSVFQQAPQWAVELIHGYNGHTWAPDIQYHDGLWYLFYSCSTFGKNTSAIGLTVNKTLDPKSPDFGWQDKGLVVKSVKSDKFNAIDPNMVVDKKGRMYLTWGSFWDGIQLARIDPTKPTADGMLKSKPVTIARRFYRDGIKSQSAEDKAREMEAPDAGANAIEAPFIVYKDGWYYLFVSWDYCCKGSRSNYKTVYGRSKKVTGPYLDKSGKDMAKGGGTLLFGPDDENYGIGHCGVYEFDNQWYFLAHAYAKAYDGRSKMLIKKIRLDADGWWSREE